MLDNLRMERKHQVIELLRKHLPDYLDRHEVDTQKIKVIETTLMCWEHELGWVVFGCPDGCGDIHKLAATCKLRFCYFCGYSQQLRWLEKLGDFLPRCPYTMITFTVPLFIRPFFRSDMKTMVDILFASAFEAVQTYAKRHGVDPLVCSCGKTKIRLGMMHVEQRLTTWVFAKEVMTVCDYQLVVLWLNDS